MELYSEGISQAKIRMRLKAKGINRHRVTIYEVIKKYLIRFGLRERR